MVRGDICDAKLVATLLREHRPKVIVHFAAESHVDRTIADPGAFIRTNVQGTFTLLEQAKLYWSELDETGRREFRFLHVSTDEVYGTKIRPLQRLLLMRPTVLMLHRRRPPITWRGRTFIPMGCRYSRPTARTTTVPSSSLKSLFRL